MISPAPLRQFVSSDTAPSGTVHQELEEGDIHDVLRNNRRRLAITCLQEATDNALSVRDLSEQVAALETGEEPPPRNKRQSVYVSLHQTHLPKLDGLGIVTYDSDSKLVSLNERVQEVEVYMEVVPRYGLSWGEFYFGLGLLGMLVTLAVLLGVPGLSAVGGAFAPRRPLAATVTIVACLFFVLVMGSAAYHVYSQQDRLLFQRLRE